MALPWRGAVPIAKRLSPTGQKAFEDAAAVLNGPDEDTDDDPEEGAARSRYRGIGLLRECLTNQRADRARVVLQDSSS